MPFPPCEALKIATFQNALWELGTRWAVDAVRPRIPSQVLDAWDALIEAWVASPEHPLLVRKFQANRGSILKERSGRELIPTDNSPAQWVFAVAYEGYCPSLDDVIPLLIAGKLPIAMALGREERQLAKYVGVRGRCPSTSDAGWKLAHISPVGLSERGSPDAFELVRLKQHFRLLMSPRNMLVVPKEWAGLAEVADFIAGFQAGIIAS